MTEDQIEHAARALCRMRGLDPRELVERVPRWCHAAKEISAALQIQQAIKEATPEPSPEPSPEPYQGFVAAEGGPQRGDANTVLSSLLLTVTGPNGEQWQFWADGRTKGFPEGSIVQNDALRILSYLLCDPPAAEMMAADNRRLRSDMKEAEALLRDARGYMRLQSSGAVSAFLDGLDRGRLMGRIQRFLDRNGA